MSDDTRVAVGTVLAGKYRVERVLGVGGMGVVVAAKHLRLEELVAIKLLLPELVRNSEVVERFTREARAAARIRSEHVARVYDVETLDDGSPYMVMEYLEGSDLGKVVATSGPLPPATAVDYMLQACEALAEAHALGVTHRDLKPENLFRTQKPDGGARIKVLDFGIAKISESDEMRMTQTNRQMGTPLYMAPEQLRSSRSADARSDIWSLGAVLFELVTGAPPFPAESIAEVAVAVATKPTPSIRTARPELPAGLDAAVARCLKVEPEARFQTVAELAQALSPFAAPTTGSSAERVARVLGGRASLPAIDEVEARAPTQPAAAHTVGGWNQAVGGAARSSRVAFAAGGALLVVVAGVVLVAHFSRSAPPAAGLVSPSAAPATGSVVPLAGPDDIPPPMTTDSAPLASAPSTSTAAAPVKPVWKPTPPSKPAPRKPNGPPLPDIH